ncbi:MAG: TonB family protein [Myxococcales bacterium]
MASLISGRTAFIGFSLVAHGFMVFGIDQIDVKKSREATAIQIAQSKKPAKKPEAKVEPPPKKPEPPAREKRASAPKPAEAPPPEAAPPPAAAPLADMPDFGVSLTGGVDGTGFAMPSGGSTRPGPRAAQTPTKAAPKQLSAAAAPAVVDGCEEPPAKPKPRSVPQPGYTDAARAAAVEGKVRVQLTVDETGHVVSVKLLQGLGYGLDEAALAAARQAEFEPAVRCGKPTSATFNISMRFSLT